MFETQHAAGYTSPRRKSAVEAKSAEPSSLGAVPVISRIPALELPGSQPTRFLQQPATIEPNTAEPKPLPVAPLPLPADPLPAAANTDHVVTGVAPQSSEKNSSFLQLIIQRQWGSILVGVIVGMVGLSWMLSWWRPAAPFAPSTFALPAIHYHIESPAVLPRAMSQSPTQQYAEAGPGTSVGIDDDRTQHMKPVAAPTSSLSSENFGDNLTLRADVAEPRQKNQDITTEGRGGRPSQDLEMASIGQPTPADPPTEYPETEFPEFPLPVPILPHDEHATARLTGEITKYQ